MSDWIIETVLDSGFGRSGAKRRAGKVENAMAGMAEFNNALELAAANQETEEQG